MESDAAAVLGEPILASVTLIEAGSSKKMRGQAGAAVGLIGSVAASIANAAGGTPAVEPTVVAPRGSAFAVATATRIALFATGGAIKAKLGEQIVVFAPGELQTIQVGKAALGVATVAFVGAHSTYVFEMSRVTMKKLNAVANAGGVATTEVKK